MKAGDFSELKGTVVPNTIKSSVRNQEEFKIKKFNKEIGGDPAPQLGRMNLAKSMPAVPSEMFKKFMKVGKLIPLIALPLLFTPTFAFAATPAAALPLASPGIYGSLVTMNQNLLMYLSTNVFNSFGLGLVSYAMILKTITHVPM